MMRNFPGLHLLCHKNYFAGFRLKLGFFLFANAFVYLRSKIEIECGRRNKSLYFILYDNIPNYLLEAFKIKDVQ